MWILRLTLFILPILSFAVIAGDEFIDNNIIDKGFRLPSDFVTKNFSLMKRSPEADYLSDYIIKANYKIDRIEADEIAKHVVKISACFKIDPWVLTGLIQKESSFKRDAISPTNAAGLTQFTSSGFKEVNDQLGFRGKEAATEAATLYFNAQILECVDPNWVDLWVRVGVPETDPDFYNLSKEELKKDIQTAVTYGAILLKTYVAYADIRGSKLEIKPSMSETYFNALQIYNGEEGDAKVKYAKNIFVNLKAAYPVPVNFSFLD